MAKKTSATNLMEKYERAIESKEMKANWEKLLEYLKAIVTNIAGINASINTIKDHIAEIRISLEKK